MKLTNKIMLAAGIIFQLSASLYADNWSDAILEFGGGSDVAVAAQNVKNNKGKSGLRAVLSIAVNQLGSTQEAMAVAAWLSNQASSSLKTSYKSEDVAAALNEFIASRVVPVSAPISSGPIVEPVSEPSSGGWSSWFSNSSDAALAQQKLDAAVATANSSALADIANSNAQGASRYNAYIDLAFSTLGQAIANIADSAVQQQVIEYAQNKLAGMKASVNANSYSSRVLGKYSSKKEPKKNKRSRAHATR
ncbi:MAG: hypothetical protein Q8Q60_03975 [Candidatus Chromulinivorax sp.]|nr:hypothetical protein [Candidatus Chromulinivorax sp.]